MVWLVEINEVAKKDLAKLDKAIVRRITAFLRERLAPSGDPRRLGEAVTGSILGNFWKYQVDECQIIASIEDSSSRILIVKVSDK